MKLAIFQFLSANLVDRKMLYKVESLGKPQKKTSFLNGSAIKAISFDSYIYSNMFLFNVFFFFAYK